MLFSKSDIRARVILYRIYDLLSISILSINLPIISNKFTNKSRRFLPTQTLFLPTSGRGHTPTHPPSYVRTCTVFPIPTEAICNYFLAENMFNKTPCEIEE